MLEFQRFDPAKCGFPRPRVALLPTLDWSDLTFGRADTTPPALVDGAGVRHFSRGRYALAAAYRAAGVGPSGALLAPAYHCRTMLDPALALGGAVLFYALNPDLVPKLDSIKAAVAGHRGTVRALVLPHYFGFEQPASLMRELAQFCSQQGITLIEDCSHSWTIAIQRAAACQAETGHVVVASPYKFSACADGGTLWGNPAQLAALQLSRQGILRELKAIKTAFAQCISATLTSADHTDLTSAERTAQPGENFVEFSDQPSRLYCRDLEGKSSLAISRWVIRRTRLSSVTQKRRDHYRAWANAVRNLKGARPLFPELPANCAPYMFPLQITAPDSQFFLLKRLGLPIWRWDEMAVSDCPVASSYRLHLLHLPCHQSLSAAQMRWMSSTVAKVLA